MHDSSCTPASDDALGRSAVEAWRRLRPQSPQTVRVDLIGDKRSLKRKKQIFRFTVDDGERRGLLVVAKKSSSETGLAEHRAYEILSQISARSLDCYGFVSDTGAETSDAWWLFIEDAGDATFDPCSDAHRASACEWIATMHVETSRSGTRHPRSRGVDYYALLCSGNKTALQAAVRNGSFGASDVWTLNSLVVAHDTLEGHWDELRLACERVPQSLTHNALLDRNLRVRHHRDAVDFLAFDWEHAGWGTPAVDIARLAGWASGEGVLEYCRRVRTAWPGVTVVDIQKLAIAGELFRSIQCIAWEAPSIESSWYSRPLVRLETYRQHLDDQLAALTSR